MTDTELPDVEIDLLTNTVDLALQHARQGRPHHGYLELLYGLERARAAVAAEDWGPGLALRWAHALAEYARRWLPQN